MRKYLSALKTTFATEFASINPAIWDTLAQIGKQSLEGRRTFDMFHTYDPKYVMDFIDRFSSTSTDPILSNKDLTPFQLQLRFITLLMALDSRRPADIANLVASKCSISNGTLILHFSSLKKWEDGAHEISYDLDADIPAHQDLREVLQLLLDYRKTLADPITDSLMLQRLPKAEGGLNTSAPTAQTIGTWVYKEVLTPAGFPEFNTYSFVKASTTEQVVKLGETPSATRWKSQRVAFRHYVKKDARYWLPRHLRENPEELDREYQRHLARLATWGDSHDRLRIPSN